MSGAPRSLETLKVGEGGMVDHLDLPESPESQRLLSLGLAPGARLRVDQRYPAFVVSVDENVIAMEASLARCIFVL